MKRILLAILTCLPGLAYGQNLASGLNLAWTQLKPAGVQPSARNDGAVAWDPVERQLFLFGGQDSGYLNDLWAYSYDRQTWALVAISGSPPPARFGHTLVYDSTRRQLLLFGGQAGSFFSDVWAFDVATRTWRKAGANDAGPKSRYGHGAIYDAARDRLVITHGFTTAGRFDDTWAFDLASSNWRELTPSGTKPLRRCLFHSASDGKDQMFIYGGCASGFGPCPLGDLWAFDLTTNQWTERTPLTSPPPREHNGLAFDTAASRLVIFGGLGGSLLSDTWAFDNTARLWTVLSGAGPEGRSRQESAGAGEVGTFMFGGSTAAGLTNELWLLRAPTLTVVDAFSGLGGSVAPGEVVSIYGSALGPTAGAAQGFDAKTGRLPVSAAGVSATWNGVAAPLYYVSTGQLNVQVPYELAGLTTARLTVGGVTSSVAVTATHPSVFPRVFNADGTVNAPGNAAARGSVIFFFATGQGVTSPASVTGMAATGVYPDPVAPVTVSMAEVVFKGQAPGTAGVMQINARLAADAAVGDAVPVRLTVGGVAAQDLVVAIR